jgi:hypothetical protein
VVGAKLNVTPVKGNLTAYFCNSCLAIGPG